MHTNVYAGIELAASCEISEYSENCAYTLAGGAI
jgi:hypothetical protein